MASQLGFQASAKRLRQMREWRLPKQRKRVQNGLGIAPCEHAEASQGGSYVRGCLDCEGLGLRTERSWKNLKTDWIHIRAKCYEM